MLSYQTELVCDGRTFERPVNYLLARILPPPGVEIDATRRPFVIVDPRAGHGPGIGGFKADSEIGVVLNAGHPCYFIGFLPDPMPGQTIEDIARAEGTFLQHVIKLHPESDGKPCVIGNCQAGWSIMMLAAIWPELFGPIIVAGSPLAYWSGLRGVNPLRYSGGLTGGSWLASCIGDLGDGRFDGAWLVANFENLNPSNTLWSKSYNLYSEIDDEAPRYLGFEKWWGGHVNLNTEEIEFIVEKLFVGNELASGNIIASNGYTVDLRNIRSPIVVFCSEGDNITPPQQALGWILDLYKDVDHIRSCGQTIVYTIHPSIGHLGIFVSGGVARKEYTEFSSNIDLIELLPPGLYEASFEKKTSETQSPDLVSGDWAMRCEERTLADIRRIVQRSAEDERRFETAKRVSDINSAIYRSFIRPMVRSCVSREAADWIRKLHPLRLQYECLSDANPFLRELSGLAESVRGDRRPAQCDNRFVQYETTWSRMNEAVLDYWRDVRDAGIEQMFLSIYGNPVLQALVGIDPARGDPFRRAGETPLTRELVERKVSILKGKIGQGGLREAIIRAMLYIGQPRGGIDERGVRAIKRMRGLEAGGERMSLAQFKEVVREQYYILEMDREAALQAIPGMLPQSVERKAAALSALRQVLGARAELTGEPLQRFKEISKLFEIGDELISPSLEPPVACNETEEFSRRAG